MKIGFIGAGNMGGAIVRAIAKANCGAELILSDYASPKSLALQAELGLSMKPDRELVQSCDYIFLGVKPQMFSSLIAALREFLPQKPPVFVTMAAGIEIESVQKMFGKNVPVIRIMPNTPVSVGEGMILYTCSEEITQGQKDEFCEILSRAGALDELKESLIDAGCAVSGCGPAFACLFAEALSDGGVACGLPREKATLYAAQMLLGTAKLLLESGQTPAKLKEDVCSPGGSTIQGVRVLEKNGIQSGVMECVIAAWERTKELGK